MAEEDLTLRMRAVGARRAAKEVDVASRSVGKLDRGVKSTDKSARKARSGTGLFSKGLRGIASTAGPLIGALGVAGVAGSVGNMISEFRASQKVSKQTGAVLKSTGGAAGLSAKQIGNMSMAISNKTGIDDEAIQSGQNMLLTFTNIQNQAGKGNDIFSQASKIMVDMGAAMHKGPGAASVMLGKALQDPVRGVTALRRVGVNLTTQQQDQIKAMTESGNVMGAQKLILRELNTEFGGSAAAQADPIDRMRVAWSNLQEKLGGALWPTITRGIQLFTKFIVQMQTGRGAGGRLVALVTRLVSVLRSMWNWVKQNRTMMLQLTAAVVAGVAAWRAFLIIQSVLKFIRIGIILFKAWRAGTLMMTAAQLGLNSALLANPIGLVIIAITALVAGLIIAYNKVGWFRHAVNAMWGGIKAGFFWIKKNWPLLVSILGGPIGIAVGLIIKNFGRIKAVARSVLGSIIGFMNSAIDAINSATPGEVKVLGKTVVPAIPDIPKIPAMAVGGAVRRSGVVDVGERGPERVHLPRGALVEPHGGFAAAGPAGEVVVPVTLTMPSGEVIARAVARASLKRRASR